MPANVDDVAAYIIEREGRISTMKLQKLCYFAQGWSLAWSGNPLFDSPIQAWKYGPVVPHLYFQHRREPSVDMWEPGDPTALTDYEKTVIETIISHYDADSGFELGELSHTHACWIDAYVGVSPLLRGNVEISVESLKQTFDSLTTAS